VVGWLMKGCFGGDFRWALGWVGLFRSRVGSVVFDKGGVGLFMFVWFVGGVWR